jgi:hypothetical protein
MVDLSAGGLKTQLISASGNQIVILPGILSLDLDQGPTPKLTLSDAG